MGYRTTDPIEVMELQKQGHVCIGGHTQRYADGKEIPGAPLEYEFDFEKAEDKTAEVVEDKPKRGRPRR